MDIVSSNSTIPSCNVEDITADYNNLYTQCVMRTREIFTQGVHSLSCQRNDKNDTYKEEKIGPDELFQSNKDSIEDIYKRVNELSIAARYKSEYGLIHHIPNSVLAKLSGKSRSDNTADARRRKARAIQREFDQLQAAHSTNSNCYGDLNIATLTFLQREQAGLATTCTDTKSCDDTGSHGVGNESQSLVIAKPEQKASYSLTTQRYTTPNSSLGLRRANYQPVKPEWHAPWKLCRVISGHLGWVRCLAVEPGNEWFASGAGDRTIKIWDLASAQLRLTLTGHISTVRALAVSPRHPYLFSAGEDKKVKCWDLETNKVVRDYHGHLSGVYTLALHPSLDVLVTGGRDGVVRVWDMRTRSNIHVLTGHRHTVASVVCQATDPQVVSGSLDSTVRLWDLAAGKTLSVLTHHKKGVRALVNHPREYTFASASTASIKQWLYPEPKFIQDFQPHNSIINTLAVNEDNVFFSGGDNGSMNFWDWKSGQVYQTIHSIAQPGSLEAEAGIMCSTFDQSGLRLVTGEADKTIKIFKPDESALRPDSP